MLDTARTRWEIEAIKQLKARYCSLQSAVFRAHLASVASRRGLSGAEVWPVNDQAEPAMNGTARFFAARSAD
ncbi:hypothetical protein [Mycobacterium lacus]|uniref:Uncharacterized protein n=1 Tax=Mycobacterium lacus TaxID=169765 RepID=A0A1X1YV70_9MYCO|nr:hypothetical protein [Mycobacterium lacus]MCV7122629.1 hypothetical protein [Mycobacterium lacus]ORW14986.1 hypothetical protein AWC15_12435 [Mycobacterium lacus]BBX95010.1 hypothetical protein MLAC_03040 [Mycobacterium lacus]